MRRRRYLGWIVGALALLIVLLVVGVRLVDEPLRRRVESGMNQALKGYKVRLGKAHFNPLGFSVDLIDWVIVQEANPEPPVASIPKLHASLQWQELVRGHVVADFRFDKPKLNLDLRNVKKEAEDKVSVKERGWQEAARAIYPFKINLIRVVDGDVTYEDEGPLDPVHVSGLEFRAANIRNIRSRPGTYPSEIHLAGVVQDQAKIRVDGNADFLAEPHAAVRAGFDLDGLGLAYLQPILRHWDVTVRSGTLSAKGEIEYAPKNKAVALSSATVERADLEYVKQRKSQAPPGEQATRVATKVTQQPSVLIKAEEARVERSKVSYLDETTDPPYRLFLTDLEMTVKNFSNLRTPDSDAVGTLDLRAKFVGTGDTQVHAVFRPKENGTDFDIALRIENADMRAMNDLWLAYGSFDVEEGRFSLYSEVSVHDGEISGYVKPVFDDLKIFSPGQETQGLKHKIYEGVVGGVASILKNRPRQEVATETSLSGRLDNPHTSIWQVFTGLVQNAFFKAILPCLKGQTGSR
jgi:hypothetical protein